MPDGWGDTLPEDMEREPVVAFHDDEHDCDVRFLVDEIGGLHVEIDDKRTSIGPENTWKVALAYFHTFDGN